MGTAIVGQASVNTAKITAISNVKPQGNGGNIQSAITPENLKAEADTIQISEEALALLSADNGGGVEPPLQKADNGGGVEPPLLKANNGDGVEPIIIK